MINHERIVEGIRFLRYFIDASLGISEEKHTITGFELSEALLDASAYNTYLETVGNKADTLYLHIKRGLTEMVTYSYLAYIKRISGKFDWKSKNFMLAFDYTDEDFYGEVQGRDIFGWTKKDAITGKFKFLTCSVISDEIPEKVPLVSIPIQIGHNMSYAITHCLHLIQPYIGNILLILFDRGFYAKELMYELGELKIPYLIFAPKTDFVKGELEGMSPKETKLIKHEYELNRDKSNYTFETFVAFLKEIYDKRLEKGIDWAFATNVEDIKLDEIIKTYKKRWRIETGFRVQDEAEIKCKSKEMKIRYFIFIFQQLLQTQWVCFYKEDASFKELIIEMQKTCKDLVTHPNKRYGKV